MKNNIPFFFGTIGDPIGVNPFFSRGLGPKNNDVVIFCIVNKTMQTFDIVLVELDSIVLFYGMTLTTRTKVGMIRQNYNVIDRFKSRAEAK